MQKLTAYIQYGNSLNLPMQTVEVPVCVDMLWWQLEGLSYTATGYGKRIPTQYKVLVANRWRRVYCYIFSNIGTLYIGKNLQTGTVVSIDRW